MPTSVVSIVSAPPRFPWPGLIALAGAVFLSVTSEMIPTGLLPEMSQTLQVSESQIGLLVTVFAFTVVVASVPLMSLTRHLPRHMLIVAVLGVLAVSNVLTAVAPSYEFVLVSRILGGLAHGLFWSVVGAYAGHLVPPAQITRAVSITLGGGSLAFVLGVPLGTMAGQALGWRMAFLALAGLMIVGAGLIWWLLPPVARMDAPVRLRGERRTRDATLRPVLIVCLVTAIIMIGHYSLYTFIAPYLHHTGGYDPALLGPLLAAYGVAGVGGLLVAGTVLGRHPRAGLVIGTAVSAVAVSALAVAVADPLISLAAFVLWGAAFGSIPPMLQTRLLHTASPRTRDAASAWYTTAFNSGIGGGALVGAIAVDAVGVQYLPGVYLAMLVVALVLIVVTDAHRSRDLASPRRRDHTLTR